MKEARGRAAVHAKGEWWTPTTRCTIRDVGPVRRTAISSPCASSIDITQKETGNRIQMDEVGLYTVRDGKIVEERFSIEAVSPSQGPRSARPTPRLRDSINRSRPCELHEARPPRAAEIASPPTRRCRCHHRSNRMHAAAVPIVDDAGDDEASASAKNTGGPASSMPGMPRRSPHRGSRSSQAASAACAPAHCYVAARRGRRRPRTSARPPTAAPGTALAVRPGGTRRA